MSWFTTTSMGKFVNSLLFGLPAIIEGFSNQGKNSDGSSNSAFGVFNQQNWKNAAGDALLGSDYQNNEPLGRQLFGTNLGGLFSALTNRITAEHLTGAEREANEFNAAQAQMDRDFQERMASTQYQRGVADMRAAGVNPALAMQNGGAAAPAGVSASSAQPQGSAFDIGSLIQLLMFKPQKELMEKQGDAALMQGQAALRNAGTREGELDVSKFDAETRRMLAHNEIRIGDSSIKLNESKMLEIAQQIKESESRIELQDIEKLAKNLDYKFDMEMYETNKALLIQELAFRAVQMSNLNQLTAESAKRIELMTNEQAGTQWMSDHPKLASGLGIASGFTGVIGNILRGSVSAVAGKWSK